MTKHFLILSILFISNSAKSQWVVPKQKAIVKPNKVQKKFLRGFVKADSTVNGSIYIAPLDGMPCLVPNTLDIAKMPNATPNKVSIYIPNPLKKEN